MSIDNPDVSMFEVQLDDDRRQVLRYVSSQPRDGHVIDCVYFSEGIELS